MKRSRNTRLDLNYRAFVRSFPCCVEGCRSGMRIDPHHLRTAANSGTGIKPIDRGNLVPICRLHHGEGDFRGWRTFQIMHGIDLAAIAAEILTLFDAGAMP